MTVIGTSAIPAVDTASIDHPVDPSPPPAVDSIVSETGIEAPTIAPTLPATQTHGKPVPATRRDSVLRNIMSSIDSGHFVIDDTLSGMKKPAGSDRKLKDRLTGLPGQGIAWVRRNPFTAAPAGIALLLFGLWVVARRNRSKEKAQRFMTTTRLSLMNGEVQRACLHIENNYMDPSLTPASVCTAIVTGQPFLETMFERELGLDIASYINQVRMHRARQIIRWNITADASFVAAKVGFRETGEFEKQFKKATGSDLETFRRNQTASPDTAA